MKNFKIGDIITRVARAEIYYKKYNDNLGVTTDVLNYTDGSYMGEPVKYRGIANNRIYFESLKGCFKGNIHSVDLENWSEGWELFELPEGVTIEDLI